MQSKNFEFIRSKWDVLATLGGFAERYVDVDPASALVKLRLYCEQLVEFLYDKHRIPRPPQPALIDLLNDYTFTRTVPKVVVSKLHGLRIHGNKAAHSGEVTDQTARQILRDSFDLACWLFLGYGNGRKADCPEYQETVGSSDESQKLRREKKAVLQELASQEARMEQVLSELEAARQKAAAAESSLEEMQAAMATGQQAADALSFDEATTRTRLIDTLLVEAGWNPDDPKQVGQEIEVEHQPTESGKGYADYVLWADDGMPLGVIEAKKTSLDPEVGRKQAEDYADGLKEMYGQRPIIFCTNGFEIELWNDGQDEPRRQVFGFYSPESLEYLARPPANRVASKDIAANPAITDRMYQIEAVKQVVENFARKQREALIVQATGTGKTRVAVSLCDGLLKANWCRRILFLCDRRELRKQAKQTFQKYMGEVPLTYVTSRTYRDREHRIYLATYPAMMKCYQSFDVGFFDLIIADESHRSIYNRYRELIKYFDAYKLGLTATPLELRNEMRNTYRLFGCEEQDPTAHFSYDDAINHVPPFLARFKVRTVTTHFLREGIKYSEMTEEQRRQLEEDEVVPQAVEFEQNQVDKTVFNRDTNRRILRNLMENGRRDATDSHVGKSIVFARSHDHAILLQKLFDEMYPQFASRFCRVIDNYESRAEELIDEFKDPKSKLTIAISVDMLDTGIDVPQVVNLVFARPVFSKIKFWQMIGRGTRLCENLFGPGKHKDEFLIFDHWGNFERFDMEGDADEPAVSKSLLQRLFESRVRLAEEALNKPDLPAFDLVVPLLAADIADLPEKTVAVREKWRELHTVRSEETLHQFAPATKAILTQDIARLMQWRDVRGHEEAFRFDNLVCQLQAELIRGSASFDGLRGDLLVLLDDLPMNLNQVRARAETIARVRSNEFWDEVTVHSLEEVRRELRAIMQYRVAGTRLRTPPKVIDVKEEDDLIEEKDYRPQLPGMELAAYRSRVESVLKELFESNETLQRIKRGEAVSDDDIETLNSLVLTQDPDLNLSDLEFYYPETAGHLDMAIRSIIGLDAEAVNDRFSEFVQRHNPTSMQIRFLSMLKNHIARYGSIELDRLYEEPFTTFNADGVDGVFDDNQIDDLVSIIETFSPPNPQGEAQG